MMESLQYFDCKLSDLRLDMQELYLLMGYGVQIPNQEILDIISEMVTNLTICCTPRCGYILRHGEIVDNEHIKVGDTILNPGKIITHAMKEADYYAIFTATAGSGFEDYCIRLKKEDDMVKNFIADALGSVIADATVTWLMNKLENHATSEGMKISNNYSPGYCDWLLIEQPKLFSIFPENISGISLTDSCLMLPVKSVSGIVAAGKHVKKRPYGCDICKMVTCIKNKKKQSVS